MRLLVLLLTAALACAAAEPPRPRRLTVDLEIVSSDRSWWKAPLPSAEVDGVLLSWGVALLDRRGAVRTMSSSSGCPQDPFCLAWDPRGTKCFDFFSPGLTEWDERYTCYADSRTAFFDASLSAADIEVPDGVDRSRLAVYHRDDLFRRKVWPSRRIDGDPAIELRLDPDPGFHLAVHLQLETGPDGRPRDLKIANCRPSGGDSARVAERIRSPEFRYCRIVDGP